MLGQSRLQEAQGLMENYFGVVPLHDSRYRQPEVVEMIISSDTFEGVQDTYLFMTHIGIFIHYKAGLVGPNAEIVCRPPSVPPPVLAAAAPRLSWKQCCGVPPKCKATKATTVLVNKEIPPDSYIISYLLLCESAKRATD